MQKPFNKTFLKYFKKNSRLILGLSGGPDSIFLGEMLFQSGCTDIIVAHFNHNWRQDEADQDEQFCRQQAKLWKWEFISEKWSKPIQSEEKARNARHNFFQKILTEQNAEGILLAHHQDDLVETVFFNFLRGTGVRGLSGLDLFNRARKIFRPLLQFSKKEILQYLENKQIIFHTDSTNADNKYARNYIRNEIFPLLQTKFPDFKKSMNRSASIFADLQQFLEHQAKEWLANHRTTAGGINREQFLTLPKALQSEIIRTLWLPKNLDFDHVNSLIDFITQAKSGKKLIICNKNLKIFGDNYYIE